MATENLPWQLSRGAMNDYHLCQGHAHSAGSFEGWTYRLTISLRTCGRRAPVFESMAIHATDGKDSRRSLIHPGTADDRRHVGELLSLLAAKLRYDLLRGTPQDNAGFLHTEEIAKLRNRGKTCVPNTLYQGLNALWRGGKDPEGQYYHFLRGFLSHRDQLWHLICFCGPTASRAAGQNLLWWLNVRPEDISFSSEGSSDPISDELLKDVLSQLFPKRCVLSTHAWSELQRLLEGLPSATSGSGGQAQEVHSEDALADEVVSYLKTLAEDCARLPYYFPAHLRDGKSGKTPFDEIRQTVRIIEDRAGFDKWLAQERERLRREGLDADGLTYGPNRGMPEADEAECPKVPVQPVVWDERASKCFRQATILGDPGFGKTWLLRYEAKRLACDAIESLMNSVASLDGIDLPVFARLPDLVNHADEKDTLDDIVIRLLAQGYSSDFREYLRRQLRSGRGVLLLDAWDEVADLKKRQTLNGRIHAFARASSARILLTSRIVGYDLTQPPLPGGKELELLAWDWGRISRFTEMWFGESDEECRYFLRELKQHAQFRGLARIPLMLRLLCQAYPDGKFPQKRSDLYGRCLRGLLRNWHIQDKEYLSKYGEAQLSDTYISGLTQALEGIAWSFHEKGIQQCREGGIRPILETFLTELHQERPWHELKKDGITPTELIKRFKDDGILVAATSGDDSELLFLHLTFQEYLAACALAKRPDYIEIAGEHACDPRWHEVLAMLGGVIGQNHAPYIAALLKRNKEDLFCRPYLLAIRAACEVGMDRLPEIFSSTFLGGLAKIWSSRSLGFLWIDAKRSAAYLPRLNEELSKLVRGELAVDENSAHQAAMALCGPGCPISPYWCFRRASAATALGENDHEGAVSTLVEALRDKDARVRSAAATALGKIGSKEAVAALVNALGDEMLPVRLSSVLALRHIRSEEAVPALTKALWDEESSVRERAAMALGAIGSEKAVPALIQILEDTEVPKEEGSLRRFLAVLAMGEIGSERAVPALKRCLRDEDRDIRDASAVALGMIGAEEGVPSLIEALHDGYSSVRHSAALALAKRGPERVIPTLMQNLRDEDYDNRTAAAMALGELGVEQAVPVLSEVLHDRDPRFRAAAARILGQIGSEQTLKPLAQALLDGEQLVRSRAAMALGQTGSEKAIPALAASLRDNDSDVRGWAAIGLGLIGSKKVVPALIRALRDEDLKVRADAAKALGRIGSEQAVPALLDVLRERDQSALLESGGSLAKQHSDVRSAAATALGQIGSKQAISTLVDVLRENSLVRDAAGDALRRIFPQESTSQCMDILPSAIKSDLGSLADLLEQPARLCQPPSLAE